MLRAKLLFKDNHRKILGSAPKKSDFLSGEELIAALESTHICRICSAKPEGKVTGLGLGYCKICWDKMFEKTEDSTQD